ncbi:MAG: class I SAM-dependent methyltransferase [Chloroflexota bacterium]
MPDSSPTSSTQRFYDELASDYDLIYADWERSIQRQADALDRIIRGELTGPSLTVLDCTCGIGTQAIGLAMRGYQVRGTDLSPASVARAAAESEKLGLKLSFAVADVRDLANQVEGTYDVVLSGDNALPHLLTDADLLRALRAVRTKLRPNGLFLASIRDYDRLAIERPRLDQPRVIDGPDGRRVTFQVWDWSDAGPIYTVHQFIVQERGSEWKTTHAATEYRALQREELTALLKQGGFVDIRWRLPDETAFFQPIVTARGDSAGPRDQAVPCSELNRTD